MYTSNLFTTTVVNSRPTAAADHILDTAMEWRKQGGHGCQSLRHNGKVTTRKGLKTPVCYADWDWPEAARAGVLSSSLSPTALAGAHKMNTNRESCRQLPRLALLQMESRAVIRAWSLLKLITLPQNSDSCNEYRGVLQAPSARSDPWDNAACH